MKIGSGVNPYSLVRSREGGARRNLYWGRFLSGSRGALPEIVERELLILSTPTPTPPHKEEGFIFL
jgi:hypothetical protein